MITYESVVIASWIVFLVVWILSAFAAKRDVRGSVRGRLVFLSWRVVVLALVILVVHSGRHVSFSFDELFFAPSQVIGWLGAVLAVVGVVFAIWARFHLGRNWSAYPTHKEQHDLVTSGPYTFVRHPIYTGAILALFGSALTGSIFAAGLFIVLGVIFVLRIRKEEGIMLDLFPDTYPAYQTRTKKLVPFIW